MLKAKFLYRQIKCSNLKSRNKHVDTSQALGAACAQLHNMSIAQSPALRNGGGRHRKAGGFLIQAACKQGTMEQAS
jgi:hypothetical protein